MTWLLGLFIFAMLVVSTGFVADGLRRWVTTGKSHFSGFVPLSLILLAVWVGWATWAVPMWGKIFTTALNS